MLIEKWFAKVIMHVWLSNVNHKLYNKYYLCVHTMHNIDVAAAFFRQYNKLHIISNFPTKPTDLFFAWLQRIM